MIIGMEKERVTHVTFRVAESTARQFKAYCALEGRDQSDVFRELIRRWITERQKQGEKLGAMK